MSEETRTRVALDHDAIDRYADWYRAFTDGKSPHGVMPSPVLFTEDEKVYFIGAGLHRISSLMQIGRTGWPCEVRAGNKWDAIAHAANTDLDGAVPRKKDDRARGVDMMLTDPVRKSWTNGQIARHCGVSDVTVGNHRKAFGVEGRNQSGLGSADPDPAARAPGAVGRA